MQKRIVNLLGDELGLSLQSLSHRSSVGPLSLFYHPIQLATVDNKWGYRGREQLSYMRGCDISRYHVIHSPRL